MSKIKKIIITFLIGSSLISGCLNKADKELLNRASLDAKEARFIAEDAARDANEAAAKAERIFKQLQKK